MREMTNSFMMALVSHSIFVSRCRLFIRKRSHIAFSNHPKSRFFSTTFVLVWPLSLSQKPSAMLRYVFPVFLLKDFFRYMLPPLVVISRVLYHISQNNAISNYQYFQLFNTKIPYSQQGILGSRFFLMCQRRVRLCIFCLESCSILGNIVASP